MTPKEKAHELIENFRHYTIQDYFTSIEIENAKECALLLVDEILSNYITNIGIVNNEFKSVKSDGWWRQVRYEIENYKPETT